MDLSKVKKILIFRLSSLGDILLTTPLIRSLKRVYPHISLHFLLREEYEPLLTHNSNIDNIYKYADTKLERQILLSSIIAENYDIVIDLQNNFRSRELIRFLNCTVYRFNKHHFKKILLVYFKINKFKKLPPIPLRYANSFNMFELDNLGLEFKTSNQPDELLQSGEEFIGICPGAKHYTKRWHKGYYKDLGKLLEANNYRIVLLGGKADKELCDEIASDLQNPVNLCAGNNIMQTAANMKMCKAIYSNDSGLMHLATSLKIPVIAFFGSTVREFGFFPYKSKSIVLERDRLLCRPCTHIGKKSCPQKHFSCMLDITPEDAYKTLNLLMAQ